MCDVEIKRAECSKVSTPGRSDDSTVRSSSYEREMKDAETDSAKSVKHRGRLRLKDVEPLDSDKDGEKPADEVQLTEVGGEKSPRPARRVSYNLPAWIVFVVLGCVMGTLRYGGILSSTQIADFKSYAPFVFIALHIFIVVRIFGDSVFSGILSLLVPPYTYYYLFVFSDDFLIRAVFAGIFVGIGVDSVEFFELQSIQIFKSVSVWIRSTG